MKKIIISLFIILLLGTIFAWTNFAIEFASWLNNKTCVTGCSGITVKNPFLTPCFYGAIMYLISFVLSAILLKKVTKK